MKPRIFVSSTFYDLKYIRDDLSNFIKAHDFEPIMFEEGDIGYTPGKQLDNSCYEAMRNADMVILIIGGSYGSPASGENADSFDEYLSVTRKEYKTASEEGIPIFVFIDASVYSEYGVYEANVDLIEKEKQEISFCATKNINVFRFIKDIKSTGDLSVTEFKKAGEIKTFLGKQWADMFKNYLRALREEKNTEQIHEALDNMSSLIKQMEIMVNGLGQRVINNDTNVQFDSLLKQQKLVKAKELARKITKYIDCEFHHGKTKQENITILLDVLCKFYKKIKDKDDIAKEDAIYLFSQMADYGIDLIGIRLTSLVEEVLGDIYDDPDMKSEVAKMLGNDFYYSKFRNEEDND